MKCNAQLPPQMGRKSAVFHIFVLCFSSSSPSPRGEPFRSYMLTVHVFFITAYGHIMAEPFYDFLKWLFILGMAGVIVDCCSVGSVFERFNAGRVFAVDKLLEVMMWEGCWRRIK